MAKAFISYSHLDDRKKEILEELLNINDIDPIVVSSKEEPSRLLSDKVSEAIDRTDYLVTILTSNSIGNQWVNQEIGYASKLVNDKKLLIIPIVEDTIVNDLKGFVHKNMDIYMFKSNNKKGIENKDFKAKCKKIIEFIKKDKIIEKPKYEIEASFSYISLQTIDNDDNIIIASSLILENKSLENISIKNIELIIPYENYDLYLNKVNNMPFTMTSYYDGNNTFNFNLHPYTIEYKQRKDFYKIKFKSKYRLYIGFGLDKSNYRNMIIETLQKIRKVKSIITLHDQSKINLEIPVYSN